MCGLPGWAVGILWQQQFVVKVKDRSLIIGRGLQNSRGLSNHTSTQRGSEKVKAHIPLKNGFASGVRRK